MDVYTCSHIRSVLCLAALLTLNFAAPSLCRTHLRTVRYASLYRLLFRTSGLGCVPIMPNTWISLIFTAPSLQSFYDMNRNDSRDEMRMTFQQYIFIPQKFDHWCFFYKIVILLLKSIGK